MMTSSTNREAKKEFKKVEYLVRKMLLWPQITALRPMSGSVDD